MYTLKRITTVPGSALSIKVDGKDKTFIGGGHYMFEPAGMDGDTVQADEHVAGAIMGDPGLAVHFECTPPWKPAGETTKTEAVPEAPAAPEGKSTRKKAGQSEPVTE